MDWMVRGVALTFSALTLRCRFSSPSAAHVQAIESHNLAIAEGVRVCRRQVRVSDRQPGHGNMQSETCGLACFGTTCTHTIMSSSIGWPTSAAHAQSYLALTAMKSGVLHPAAARVLAALTLQIDNPSPFASW